MKTSVPFHRIALVLLLAMVSFVGAADWPQWRGPDRDGRSAETSLLPQWPKDGPPLLWQVTNIHAGYSTPSVVGDRLYLLANDGLDNEQLLTLSTKDGSAGWSTRLGKVGHPKQDPNYPAARSTPTVDGSQIFALGSDGDLVCLEKATGKQRWRKHLRNDFGGKHGEWAYAESPLIDADAVICTPGGSNVTLLALNKNSGDVIWKCVVPGTAEASYSSIVAAELGGVKQYVQFLPNGLVGVEARSGKLLWHYPRNAKGSPAVVMTPLVSDGFVYSGAFRAGGALVRPVKKDGQFLAEEIYFNNKLPVGLGGVVKSGDYFYGSSGQSLMCAAFKTGEIQWEERGIGPSSSLLADGRIYLHAENGDVALLEPAREAYREKGRFTPPNRPAGHRNSKAWAYPVIAEGRLYIREWNSLWCYDVKSRK